MNQFYVRVTKMSNGSTVVLIGHPEDEEMGCGLADGTGVGGTRLVWVTFLNVLGRYVGQQKQLKEFWETWRRLGDKDGEAS